MTEKRVQMSELPGPLKDQYERTVDCLEAATAVMDAVANSWIVAFTVKDENSTDGRRPAIASISGDHDEIILLIWSVLQDMLHDHPEQDPWADLLDMRERLSKMHGEYKTIREVDLSDGD